MAPSLIIHVFPLFLFCLILAALETQIEGEAGWAANLPTARPSRAKWFSRLYSQVMEGKELTLYHIFVFSLPFVFLHYPYFTGKAWSFTAELTTLAFFFLVVVVWDFLWFVVNPRYDFGRFWGRHVVWHKKWFWHLPVDYWFAFILSILLYMRFSLNLALFKEWLEIVALFLIFTLAVMVLAMASGILRVKKEFKK